jgi:hypothetical protein
VRITIAADDELVAADGLASGEGLIAQRISAALGTHSKAAALAERLLVKLTSEVQQATTTVTSATAAVLAATPPSYPANKYIFSSAKASLAIAAGNLIAARRLVDEIDIVLTF